MTVLAVMLAAILALLAVSCWTVPQLMLSRRAMAACPPNRIPGCQRNHAAAAAPLPPPPSPSPPPPSPSPPHDLYMICMNP